MYEEYDPTPNFSSHINWDGYEKLERDVQGMLDDWRIDQEDAVRFFRLTAKAIKADIQADGALQYLYEAPAFSDGEPIFTLLPDLDNFLSFSPAIVPVNAWCWFC